MNKGGGSKARPETSKIDRQTLEDILRSPDDSSDEDIQKERQTETFTNELKNKLQQTKNATGQASFTFRQNLNHYELSDSSSEDDEDEKEVAEAVKGITQPLEMQSALANSTRYDFFRENIHDPKARAALVNALSSGDDSDGSDSSNEQATAFRKQDTFQRQPSQLQEPKPLQRVDVLQTIELNEKQNDMQSDKLAEQAGQLLSFKKEYYDLNKQLIMSSTFAQIQEKLFDQPDHKYYGVVSCINLFRNFIFIGNSTGYIRVFDTKTQKEMKPLYDEQVAGNKVTSIDITEDGHYLLSGYKKGSVVLWDANKYKLARFIPDISKSEITAAKILYVTQEGTINLVVAEDVGRIRFVEVFKGNFFGGYNHNVIPLYEERLIGASTISVCNPSNLPGYESKFCAAACLVAFGASNQVVLCSMRPIKELLCLKPSKYNRKRSVPYVDWGYGLTPTIREKTMPLMAVAWDRMIQLIYVNDQTNDIQLDGYYCCDEEINQVYFMADSILVILVNSKELKILYTTKFQPGDYKYLDVDSGKDDLYQSVFKEAVSVSRHCELWHGFDFSDIRRGVIAINNNKQQFSNFNNTITKFQKSIIFAGSKTLTKARLLSWREYIEKLKFSDNYDWLTVLKAALEIYNGELKGFALLPDEKERREEYLKDYMKKLIMTSIQTVLYKFQKVADPKKTDSESQDDTKSYSIEDIAIKVSIEFCLNINETQFLFTDIFEFFRENGLRENFISLLCPPIVAGQFRKEYIPEPILEKIIVYLEAKQNYKILEKIIQQLDLSKYKDSSTNKGAVSMRPYLEVLCSTNCMVSALLYLYTSQTNGDGGCKQILEMMHKNMCDKKSQEDFERKRNPTLRQIVKEDIRNMQGIDRESRYMLEKSYLYTGYKLLWIIKMFLEGKKFPYGSLTNQQWQQHTFQIIDFLMSDKYLNDVFVFDPEMFFKVIAKIFCGQPWRFFSYWRHTHPSSVDPWDFFMKLETEALRTSRLDKNSKIINAFYEFVLNVLVTQYNEKAEILEKENEMTTGMQIYRMASEYRLLDIEQNVVVKAVLNAFEQKESQIDIDQVTDPKLIQQVLTGTECPVNETLIIETLDARKFDNLDIDAILGKMANFKHPLTTIKVKLYEKKQDYVEAFELHFSNPQLKKKVFSWLEVTLQSLHDEELIFLESKPSGDNAPSFEPLSRLKLCIRKRMVELAQMSCEKTRILISKWFDEGQYQQQLIMNELANKPEIQFKYLLSYVIDNEKEISETIKESVYQPERQKQAQLYTTFLIRFTRLLCEFEKKQVEKWVKREYFPVTECLEVCRAMKNERGEAVLLKREGQYLPAIQQYLNLIEKLDVAVLVDNMCRAETNKETVSSDAWDFGKVSAFDAGLGSFDENLEKACKIAEKKENGCNVTGDAGWFAILEFLQNFSVMASIKVNEVLQRAEKKKSLFDRAATIAKETHVERLKDFVNRRINYILKKPTLEISLKTIMSKLELKYLQVQRLYNHKIAILNEEMRLEVYSERILNLDVNTLFFDICNIQRGGAISNPLDRPVVMSNGKKIMVAGDATQMCQHCRLALVGTKQVIAQNIIVFNVCGHQYHQNCIAQLDTMDVCPMCERFVLQEANKADGSKNQDKNSKSAQKKKATAQVSESSTAPADSQESNMKRSLNLVMRTLESFDMQMEQQMLTSVDFATK